jgi:hypothetical protein
VVDARPTESKATHQPDTGQVGLPSSPGVPTDAAQEPVKSRDWRAVASTDTQHVVV